MRTSRISVVFILLLCLFLGVSHLNWLSTDNTPQRWDESIHLGAASGFRETIEKSPTAIFHSFISQESYYPPLVPFLASFFGLKNPAQDNFTAVMALFLCGMVVFTFLYARLYTGALQAMAAAAIIAAYPVICRESHFFMLDLPLTFFFIMSLYLLKKSRVFTDMRYSVLLGFACGFGMLVKWSLVVYMLAPLALEFFAAPGTDEKKRGILPALLIFVLTAAPWYIYNSVPIIVNLLSYSINRQAVEGLPKFMSAGSLLMYFRMLPGVMSWPLLALLAAGTYAALKERGESRGLVLMAAAGLFIFILIPNKKDRYLMPLMPLFAVISVYAAGLFPGKKAGVASAVLISVFALFSFVSATYEMPYPWPESSRPSRADWHINDFLSRVVQDSTLAVVSDNMYMNNSGYAETARNFYPGVRVTGIYNFPMFTDYFVLKTGDMGPEFSGLQKRREILNAAFDPKSAVSRLYEKIYETSLPDGSTGMLFKRKSPVIADKDEYAGTINAGIIAVIPQYVKKLEKFSCRVVMDGDSADLKVSFARGYAGDFRHKEAGLVVHDAAIEADGIKIDMDEAGGLKILSVGDVRLNSLTVKQGELEDFLKLYAGKFKITSVKLEKGIIDISGEYLKTPVEAAVSLYNPNPEKTGSDIFFRVVKLKAAGISIPAGLVNFVLKGYNPLLNKSNSPIKISFGQIYAENGELNIK
jgi:hypothetical protein